ncbi:MAG: hypothetical protein ACTTH5_02980 [Wolinella sp.]
MEAIDIFKERFNAIDSLFAQSKIYLEAKASFDEGLVRHSFTEQEKATAYAEFMAKAFQTSLATATEAALRLGITYEQELSEASKREGEISAVEEQVLKIKIEQDLALANRELVLAQGKNEHLRETELEASIKLKEQQLLGAYISNTAENEKRKVLIQTANDNAIIKRAEHLINYLKILSDDKDFKITEKGLHEQIKSEVLGIGKRELTHKDIEVKKVELAPFNPAHSGKRTPLFRIITRGRARVLKSAEFYCLSAGCDQKELYFRWSIEGATYSAQKVSHQFKNKGAQEVICEVLAFGETYRLKEVINVL